MRMVNSAFLAAIAVTLVCASTAIGQRPVDPVTEVTRFNLSGGYRYIKANAPPGGCKCFGTNGGYVAGGLQFNQWLGLEGQVTATHANDISLLGQEFDVDDVYGGVRESFGLSRSTFRCLGRRCSALPMEATPTFRWERPIAPRHRVSRIRPAGVLGIT